MTTESDLWNRLRPQFIKAGALPIRLENAANLSVPDVALILPDTTIWVELKIAKGNQIRIPKHQYAFGAELAKQADTELFWMLADWRGDTVAWVYRYVLEHISEGNGDYVIFDAKPEAAVPLYTATDIKQWINRNEERELYDDDIYGSPA